MARPRKDFNQKIFKKLCAIQCTEAEIANWFNVSPDTINRRCHQFFDMSFADTYKKYSEHGKISLRRKQMQVAIKGNVSMLIWLGKQILGQADKQEQKVQFEGDVKFTEKFDKHLATISKRFGIPV